MSNASMSTTLIDPAILDTVLGRLALLFLAGAGDDMTVARHAAGRLLIAYKVETEEELSLAAEIISFSYHALAALCQAMEPDLSLNKVIRLRGSAVSLSREAHRNQRKLDQLQRDRRTAASAPLPETSAPPLATPDAPAINQATAVNALTRQEVKTEAWAKTWTQSYHDRQRDKRLAESARKRQNHPAPPLTQTGAAMAGPAASAAVPPAQTA